MSVNYHTHISLYGVQMVFLRPVNFVPEITIRKLSILLLVAIFLWSERGAAQADNNAILDSTVITRPGIDDIGNTI